MMFYWRSEYMMQYSNGHILVNANSETEAREKARDYFDIYDKEHYEWNYGPNADEDDADDIEVRREVLENDISRKPDTDTVVFINGSE